MNATHTPGPWAVWQFGRELAITCTGREKAHRSEGMHIACVRLPAVDTQWDELFRANARLLAAAPDLLAALEAMVSKAIKQNWNDGYPERLAQAEAAIAKATGAP